MCLSVPAKITGIEGDKALVEFGGASRKISIAMLPEAKVGDYVIVHAGYAISKLDEREALEELGLWKEVMGL
ncbi:MAG: hydrogenase expression/formation protein HypC [Moorella sp. (in: firmicutes)]|nr:hydrogenase expression/formation protein HypC [Moorella sp. (in: firmicutes)]